MRRKIAKRKRRELLKMATITSERWEREPGWRRKDCCYVVEATCRGWKICAPSYDELAAYKAALDCFEFCNEEPRNYDN